MGGGVCPAPDEPVMAKTETGAPGAARPRRQSGARPRIDAVAKQPGEAIAREAAIFSRKSSGSP